jgi:hypothetical protein
MCYDQDNVTIYTHLADNQTYILYWGTHKNQHSFLTFYLNIWIILPNIRRPSAFNFASIFFKFLFP